MNIYHCLLSILSCGGTTPPHYRGLSKTGPHSTPFLITVLLPGHSEAQGRPVIGQEKSSQDLLRKILSSFNIMKFEGKLRHM